MRSTPAGAVTLISSGHEACCGCSPGSWATCGTAGSLGKRYWFDTKPTLNNLIVRHRQQAAKDTSENEILADLPSEAQKGAFAGETWRVIADPAEGSPEQKSLTLLVLPPSLAWDETAGQRIASTATRSCSWWESLGA